MVELLEGVAITIGAGHVLDQPEDRHRRLHRFGHRRHQQRRRRPVLGSHDSDTTRDSGVAVGHHAARVLGPVGDLPDAHLRCGQEQRRGQALPEDVRDPVARQPFGQRVGHRSFCMISLPRRRRRHSTPMLRPATGDRPIPLPAGLRRSSYHPRSGSAAAAVLRRGRRGAAFPPRRGTPAYRATGAFPADPGARTRAGGGAVRTHHGGCHADHAGHALAHEGCRCCARSSGSPRSYGRPPRDAAGGCGSCRPVRSQAVYPTSSWPGSDREHPEVEIEVETAWTMRNIAMVRAAEADAAFVRLPCTTPTTCGCSPWARPSSIVMLPATHPLARRRVVRPGDLREVTLSRGRANRRPATSTTSARWSGVRTLRR